MAANGPGRCATARGHKARGAQGAKTRLAVVASTGHACSREDAPEMMKLSDPEK